MMGLQKTFACHEENNKSRLWVWNEANYYKECYREQTAYGVLGEERILSSQEFKQILRPWISYVEKGINLACEKDGGVPTYFSYQFDKYRIEGHHIIPKNLEVIPLPLFLEGYVRYLKLPLSRKEKLNIYESVKKSGLYDSSLRMYKVNEPLKDASFEIGRAKAFSPGWLENESIWLHMEYKYLLELLKSNLYEEFFQDFHNACIPFLPEEIYGRSPLENSSFIASSANEDEKIHGKGFVARLSGSTAEFLEMWQIMMFGESPFRLADGQLLCCLEPVIPEYLIPENKIIEVRFLGKTEVSYHFSKKKDIIPGSYQITKMLLKYFDGKVEEVKDAKISGALAERLRSGGVKSLIAEID